MSKLNTKPNISEPDDFYSSLIAMHEGLSDEESAAFNARLIFILANQIGDLDILKQAMHAASESG